MRPQVVARLRRSVMRRILIPSLFAVLALLPWSSVPARTPLPQGWEERDKARNRRLELQDWLNMLRPVLEDERNQLFQHEAARGGREWRPQPSRHPQTDPLIRMRQDVDKLARRVTEFEQELAQ